MYERILKELKEADQRGEKYCLIHIMRKELPVNIPQMQALGDAIFIFDKVTMHCLLCGRPAAERGAVGVNNVVERMKFPDLAGSGWVFGLCVVCNKREPENQKQMAVEIQKMINLASAKVLKRSIYTNGHF